MLEERIIHITVSGRVDSQHVTTTLVFQNRLPNVLFVFQIGSLLKRLEERRVLNWVIINKSLDVTLNLVTSLPAINLLIVAT